MSRPELEDPSDRVEMPSRRQALFTARDALFAAAATPALPGLAWAANAKAPAVPQLRVMHGFADHQGILLWLQGERAQPVRLEVMAGSAAAKPLQLIDGELAARDDFTTTLAVAGLDPGTQHHYVIRRPDTKAVLARGAFKTQVLWQWRTDPPTVRIAAGSCAYLNDARYDRPGKPYGGGEEIYDTIAGLSPDLMLWLGDYLYLREADTTSRAGINYRYRYHRKHPSQQKLYTACPQVALWDDHDFGPDDSDASYSGKGWSSEVFGRYWPMPYAPPADGFYGQMLQGDVELFLLDCRSYRDPNHWPNAAGKAMYGAKQIQWLKKALTYSTTHHSPRAPFRIICGGSQFLNRVSGDWRESWAYYPDEQGEFLRWLAERKIPGVFFLSGDRHFAQHLRFERPGLYPLNEITTSPLTSGLVSRIADEEKNSADIVPGTMLMERNFAMITVTGPRAKRELAIEIRDAKGGKRWEWRTTAAELAPGTRS